MAYDYKTPGVYLEEIVKLPPSVASVETAIPCFFGVTQKAIETNDDDLIGKSQKIQSLAEYEQFYGYADITKAEVLVKLNLPSSAKLSAPYYNNIYYAVKHYFDNGGGPCYIHSIGKYDRSDIDATSYKNALLTLDLVDEATLIVMPDLAGLNNVSKYYDVYDAAMLKASDLKDKFVIIDILPALTNNKTDINKSKTEFRNTISSTKDVIKYAAAYFPYLQTTYSYDFASADIKLGFDAAAKAESEMCALLDGLNYKIAKQIFDVNNVINLLNEDYFKNINVNTFRDKTISIELKVNNILSYFSDAAQQTLVTNKDKLIAQIETQAQQAIDTDKPTFDYADTADKEKENFINQLKDKTKSLYDSFGVAVSGVDNADYEKLNDTFLSKITPFFNSIFEAKLKEAFLNIPLILPPSAAIAGVYANVDRMRGVWKAPANVSLNAVVKPEVFISDIDQKDFNVDAANGKSINCIRQFVGRGNIVWGARTLAGNDNEWKYVNVRRFFNMVEESCKNAANQFVFEPNDANTWVRVKGMIDNYLTNLWRAGALQGAKPEHAFYVAVGLNQTMTANDVLNGYLIVEIGLAVVRPAEFIVLRFSHKLAVS